MSQKIIDNIEETVLQTPSEAIEGTIQTSKQIAKTVSNQREIRKAVKYWQNLGPGLTTGAADDDPSGIATYSQTGAKFGFQFLWLAPLTFPFMAIVQEMCARIGLVTGQGLAANIRTHFPRWVLYLCTFLLFSANSFNIGADLGAMAKSMQLLFPSLNFAILVLFFAVFCLVLQIFMSYKQYSKYLKWLTLVLLSYVLVAFNVPNLDWSSILKNTLVPSLSFSKDHILIIAAILGTTISPYLFFWQTSQEIEEEILMGKVSRRERNGTSANQIKKMRTDVFSGMFFSNLVMYFIIIAAAATLFVNGITNIATASDAAEALRPIAGDRAYLFFTIGIIGTGLLAIPILAGSASYAMSESFGWKFGLYRKLKEASSFYGMIVLSVVIGLAINLLGFDPIKALIYSAVFNGLVAPVVLIMILLLSSNKNIMGEHANSLPAKLIGWVITIIMLVVGAATIISLLGF